MSKTAFCSSVAIALLAIVLAVGVSVVSSEDHVAHAASSTVIHVVEHYTSVIVHISSKSDAMGDLNPFAGPLYDAANKKQVGTESGSCIRTIVGKLWECNWTVFLKHGQISVEGPSYDNNADAVYAIIGGTGIYSNVRGELKTHARNKAATLADYLFYLS